MGSHCITQGAQPSSLWKARAVGTGRMWEGGSNGREVQMGGNICIPVADSCWCMAEMNTTL